MVASAVSEPSATVASFSDRLFKQEKHVATPGNVQPRKSVVPAVTLEIDAVRVSSGGRHSSKNSTQGEMWRAYCAEIAEQAPVIRRLRSGQEQLAVSPKTRRAAPPPTGS